MASAVLTTALCQAQSPAADQPKFEVAAIKHSEADDSSSSSHFRNGRISIDNMSLKQIVMSAYNVQAFQLNGPSWIETERYNIDAKAETKVEDKQLREMMQSMLADRFKLALHHEEKQWPGYAMVVAKSGLKIKPTEGEGSGMNTNNTKLTAKHANMKRLADWASRVLGQPVNDETGINDSFDFTLEFARERRRDADADSGASTLPSIFTAFTEQLGLKLESRKIPIDILIIDHIEKPTEN
jgi:uncharacterized protein (TIGR03435 family)